MSFIDLMASDVWSATDIDNKVQALIRSRYSQNDELKAARLARSGDDADFVAAVDAWIASCVDEGRQARDDMALLLQVFNVEAAQRRLAQPEVDPSDEENYDRDSAERAAAQTTIDSATPEALKLVAERAATGLPPEETHDTIPY